MFIVVSVGCLLEFYLVGEILKPVLNLSAEVEPTQINGVL
jgi:hypothetical protein